MADEEIIEEPTEEVAEEEPTEEVAEQPEEQPEEVEEEETQEEVEDEVAEEVRPKRKQTAQERINELTRIRREKEREADYWKKVALEKKPAEPVNVQPELPARPKLENFDTQEAYEDSLFEWRDNINASKTQQAQSKAQMDSDLAEFNKRAQPYREQFEDFDEVIEAPVFTPLMQAALLKSDNGPEVAYFLGRPENQDTAHRIGKMQSEMQLYELGKLEQNLMLAKRTKKATKAPAPIKPVGISGGSQTDTSKMTIEQWMEYDKQQEIKKIEKKLGGPT